jgi:hypothetical protein
VSLRTFFRNWAIGSTGIVAVAAFAPYLAGAGSTDTAGQLTTVDETPVAGMAGADTALPLTNSAVTVAGRGKFADLQITVNQTANLANQAVSLTWTGAQPTGDGSGVFSENFLQIMQCWGDDDGTNADNPGPPPEQCEFGAAGGLYGGASQLSYPNDSAMSRSLGSPDWAANQGDDAVFDDATQFLWRPFRSIDGTEIARQFDPVYFPGVPIQDHNLYWLNTYFSSVTTNEIAAARTYQDGTGQALFEVLTGVQSSGLGCGKRAQPVDASTKRIPRCWLVIVPRGSAVDENADTPYSPDQGISTSPLSRAAWANRIAVELEFNPVDNACSIDADDRRLAGTDLAVPAVGSWQPVLCTTPGLPPYSYAPVGDPLARRQITNPSAGAAGMAVVSRPIDPAAVTADQPLVYAPLTASGVVIGFNIERIPKLDAPQEDPFSGSRVAHIKLTPRLVAKLLSQSYRGQLNMYGVSPDYGWLPENPYTLNLDPDFLRFNPEFQLLRVSYNRSFSALAVPQGNSDAATLVWQWILADPEAKAWLDGRPDEWGMQVNPYYSTDADLNPTGIPFGSPSPVNFPKSEPWCYQPPQLRNGVVASALCGTDWNPYRSNMADSAKVVRSTFDGARVELNEFGTTSQTAWDKAGAQFIGSKSIMSITDTPSAARLGVQMASLSRAGDDGTTREFVYPDANGLAGGVAAMAPKDEPAVLEPDPAAQVAGAYPLTVLSYGVTAPLALDTTARTQYAGFVRYAAGPGQVQGVELGNLPPGYVPLPDSLRAQAHAAADEIESLQPTPTTTTTTEAPTTTTEAPTTTTSAPDVASSSGGGGTYYPPAQSSTRSSSSSSSGRPQPTPSATTTVPVTAPSIVESTAPPPSTTEPSAPATSAPPPSTQPAAIGDEPQAPVEAPPVLTPVMELSRSRMAIPGIAVIGLGSALGALEITKRPRRAFAGFDDEEPSP